MYIDQKALTSAGDELFVQREKENFKALMRGGRIFFGYLFILHITYYILTKIRF